MTEPLPTGKIRDLRGLLFGRLTVLEFAGIDRHRNALWLCRCSCAAQTVKVINGACLRKGSVTGCGCLLREKKPKFAPAEDAQIAEAYFTGTPIFELRKQWSASWKGIANAIQRTGRSLREPVESLGISRRRFEELRRDLNDADTNAIIADYQSGDPIPTIAPKYSLTNAQVRSMLRLNGIQLRSSTRRYRLNEAAFEDAENNPLAAYFVGLIMADGCIQIAEKDGFRSASLTIGLSGNDGQHLEVLRQFLGSTRPLRVAVLKASMMRGKFLNQQPQTILSATSRRLVDSLARYGVVPRKSLTAKVMILERNRYFWCGMVCGDGWLCRGIVLPRGVLRRRVIGLTGSRESMEQFREFCHPLTGCWPSLAPNGAAWRITYNCRAARIITRTLFGNSPFALPRKLALAQEAMAERDKF